MEYDFNVIYNKKELKTPKIYLDDTLDIIKKKIIIGLNYEVSFDELYLYIVQEKTYDPSMIYELLTQNETLELNKQRMNAFLQNFDDIEIEDKEIYDYNDLLKLQLEKTHLVKVPLGQKYNIKNTK